MIEELNPLSWFRRLGQFAALWCGSIPWTRFVAGVPALLVSVLIVVLFVLSSSEEDTYRRAIVDAGLQDAVLREDFNTADLLLRRKVMEGDDRTKVLLQLANVRDQMGESEEALDLMRRLVAERSSDDAAMWLLKELYEGKSWTDLEPNEQDEFGQLLTLLEKNRPKDMGIKQNYANYLIAANRLSAAIPVLRQLAEVQPMRGLQAAALSRRLDDGVSATRFAETTLEKVGKLHEEDPSNAGLVLANVQCMVFLDEHSDAVALLDESIPLVRDEKERLVLRQAMGDVIVAWINKIELEPNETEEEKLRVLRMLQVALQYAPNNPRVMTLVSDQLLRTIEDDSNEVQTIRDSLIEGSSPGISHFVRGTTALIQDDVESATNHLMIAAKHMPTSAAILNNLAVAISEREDPNLEHALKLSDFAIKQAEPATPHFFDTRGHILVKLERYLDAIPDLERALAVQALASNAHEKLALCYEEINEPELAKEHRDAAVRKSVSAVESQEEPNAG